MNSKGSERWSPGETRWTTSLPKRFAILNSDAGANSEPEPMSPLIQRKRCPDWPFMVADYLANPQVTELSLEQQGALVRLWCHAWQDAGCSIPLETAAQGKLLGLPAARWGRIAGPVLRIFAGAELEGRLVCPMLQRQRIEQDDRVWAARSKAAVARTHKAAHSLLNSPGWLQAVELARVVKALHIAGRHTEAATAADTGSVTEALRASLLPSSPPPLNVEERHPHPAAGFVAPTIEQVLASADRQAVPRDAAEKWFADMESVGWLNRHNQPLVKWEAMLRSYGVSWREIAHLKARRLGSGGEKNGAKNPGAGNVVAQRIERENRLKELDRRIAEHPASDRLVYEQDQDAAAELRALRVQRKKLAEEATRDAEH